MTDVILDALRVALADSNFLVGIAKMWPQDPHLAGRFQAAKEKLTTAIAAREAEGWQPIETAPKLPENAYGEGPTIILLNGFKSYGKPTVRTGYWRGRRTQDWCDTALGRVPSAPTHWRPLPPPPEVAP